MKEWIKMALHDVAKLIVFIIAWVFMVLVTFFNTILGNLWHLGRMLVTWKLIAAIKLKRKISKSVTTFDKLKKEVAPFKYEFDGPLKKGIFSMFPTWVPLIIVFLDRNKTDNCDGAAHYTMWLWRQLKKNKPTITKVLSLKHNIYVPYIIWRKKDGKRELMFWKVHYVVIVTNHETCKLSMLSNGQYTDETPDTLASRYLRDEYRYIWMK